MDHVRIRAGLAAALAGIGSNVLATPAAPAAAQGDLGLVGWIIGAVLVAGAGLFVVRMRKSKDTPANPPLPATPPAPAPVAKPGVRRGFDEKSFLAEAKASFVRMQTAWDKADTDDLSKFTTPEVFAELKTQVEARGVSGEVTEVVTIDAELLGIDKLGQREVASVKFTGTIRSSAAHEAEPFAEVWNLSKPLDSSTGWMLAGIQQLS